MQKLILGSGSPRRKEILELADIKFEVLVSDIDESFNSQIPIIEIAEHLAKRKAVAIQKQFHITNQAILTADTIVVVDNQILGKPANAQDAYQMLKLLSDKTHQVHTGVCYLFENNQYHLTDTTFVKFGKMTDDEIWYYIEKYAPMDKAGAYAIQEWIGVRYIQKIEGCYYNVMGLPLPKILHWLK
ncbi:MAG: Maf family protein [Chitinophagales bacterium]|nr:Maf family protein [Chitinophagales bacterium]MCZ2393771.1 Maf family protein [Chitinophagales bacterium]